MWILVAAMACHVVTGACFDGPATKWSDTAYKTFEACELESRRRIVSEVPPELRVQGSLAIMCRQVA